MPVPTTVTFAYRIEHAAFGAILDHFARMPLDRAAAAGADWLVRLGPLTPAHRTALRNLRLAFPNESEAWRTEVARAMWAGIGRTAGEFAHLEEIGRSGEAARITVFEPERLAEIRDGKIPTVFVSGHFANWELMPIVITQAGVPCHMTYRPANNPLIDQKIQALRTRSGMTMQAAKGVEGGMGLMRALARKHSVALMNDQKYNEGVETRFFGYPCMTADGPTRLARRFGARLQAMSVVREETGSRFRVTVHAPFDIEPQAPDAEAVPRIVQRITDFVEARVRERPDQWFWVHRRWPKEAWRAAGAL